MTMHNRLLWIVAGLAVGLSARAVAQEQPRPEQSATTQPAEGPPGRLEFSPKEFSFGELWQGMPAKQVFTVKNTGQGPLTVEVRRTCGCTPVTKPKSPLAPGESTEFTAEYGTMNYVGPANKKVLLITSDPEQPKVEIPVKGEVKQLIAADPGLRIIMQQNDAGEKLDMQSVDSSSVKLEVKYDEPLKLKLKEGQDFGSFEIAFRELKPGREYELKATTRPPLRVGWNKAMVVLETGWDKVPEFTVPVGAHTQPRVMATPFQLTVRPHATGPTNSVVRVQYRMSKPVKITEVKASLESIKWELLPPDEPRPGSNVGFHRIRVTLPPYDEIPEDGAVLEIHTDDKAPEYQRLEVPVKRGRPRARGPKSGEQGAKPVRISIDELRDRMRGPKPEKGEEDK